MSISNGLAHLAILRVEKQSAGAYKDCGFTLAKTSGYVSAFGYSQEFDWLFLTSETTGNSSVPVGDYFWILPYIS